MKKVEPHFVGADDFYLRSGLDFWITPSGARAKVPVHRRQYLLTRSAIDALTLGVPFVGPRLNR